MPQNPPFIPPAPKSSPAKTHTHHDEHDHVEWCPRLDRRAAVRLLSLTTLASVAGCGSGGKVTATSSETTGTTATTTTLVVSSTDPAKGANVTLTATVSPNAATGTVSFLDGTTTLGTATLSSGVATLATSFSTTGSHVLTATYGGSSTYAASTSASVTITVGTSTACSETLEGEEGPYFVDDSASGYLRSNILSNLDGSNTQTGIPLTLTVYVFDSEKSCAAMQNVQVDIWHCSATGIYSAESSESTVGESWLRGYQLTDVSGMVSFTTIIPGWYSGRTTHIHLRLRSTYDDTDNSGTNTTQLFFDQTFVDTIDTTISPYSTLGTNPTTNATDRVYADQVEGTTLLTLTGSNSAGYTATANLYLPITTV